MLREHDPPKEPARNKAERRWKNAEARRRFKEAQQRPKLVDQNSEPEIAETITNEAKPKGPIKRFARKFAKEIRSMLEGHVNKNLAIYAAYLERRRYVLLKEKLRRLQAARTGRVTMMNLFGAQRELTLEEIDWGPGGKPSAELLEARACMAKINERERLQKVAKEKEVLPYSDNLAQEICELVAIGGLLINICRDEDHLPSLRRCNTWLREHTEFAQLYQSAIQDRLNIFEEEVIKIADDMQHDFRTVIKNGREKRVADPDMVARAKLIIDVRFKWLGAFRPQRWGDVQTLNVKSSDEFDPANYSRDALEKEIAQIEMKSRTLRPVKAA